MSLLVIIVSFLVGIFAFPYLPQTMITHWGLYGQPNGYSPRSFAVFFMPVLMIILFLLFKFLPKTDPYKKNFDQFKSYYDNFVIIILGFLFYLYLLTLLANFYSFNLIRFLPPAFAVLFYYTGVLMSVAKQNWFVGFRTPWTLSNETVWSQTHRLGSKLFKITALTSLLGIFFPNLSFYLIIAPLLVASLFTSFYSYYLFHRLHGNN